MQLSVQMMQQPVVPGPEVKNDYLVWSEQLMITRGPVVVVACTET